MLVSFSVDLFDTEHSIRGKSITSRAVWITNITLITAITFFGVYDARGRFKCVIDALNMTERLRYEIGAKKRSEREGFMTLYACYAIICTLVALNEYTDISLEIMENYDDKLDDRESTLFFNCNKIKSKTINSIIDSMTMEYNRSEKKVNQEYTQSVRELVNMYSSICHIIERLGTKHEPLLLLLLGSFFLYIVVTPYYQIFLNIYTKNTATCKSFIPARAHL
ncbi:unnamed protein product [Pieris brassicae]|uniref:Gustatory receptor n=1 Tax=Pieris brassicae TaxID=7116 RepID=A0A9P0TF58_PIEBR|nr:unnamed protein product [Pieris brassicae]